MNIDSPGKIGLAAEQGYGFGLSHGPNVYTSKPEFVNSPSTPVNGLPRNVRGMVRTFQSRFREAFQELGISQAEFARAVGMTRANVTHWLSGRGKKPSGELAARASRKLGVELAWLVNEEGEKRQAAPRVSTEVGTRGGAVATSAAEPPREIGGMEYTRESLEVARAYMKLPEKLRAQFKRGIETEALNWAAEASDQMVAGKFPATPGKPKGTAGKVIGMLILAIGLFVIDCYDETVVADPLDDSKPYICPATARVGPGFAACQKALAAEDRDAPQRRADSPREPVGRAAYKGNGPRAAWKAQCEAYFNDYPRANKLCEEATTP